MVKTKRAFSFIEAIITMTIISLIGSALLTVLTKQAVPSKQITQRGQFACWWGNDDNLYQWQFDERTPKTERPVNVTAAGFCRLPASKRQARLYVAARGAGVVMGTAGNGYFGQTSSTYLNSLEGDLIIVPGKINDKGLKDTKIFSADDEDDTTISQMVSSNNIPTAFIAKGIDPNLDYSATLLSGTDIVPGNVKECRLLSRGVIPGYEGVYPQVTQCSCSVVDISTTEQAIRINPCSSSAGYNSTSTGYNPSTAGYNSTSTSYNPSTAGYNSTSTGYNSTSSGYEYISDISGGAYRVETLRVTNDGSSYSPYIPPYLRKADGSSVENSVRVNLLLKDSDYVLKQSSGYDLKLNFILNSIPSDRKSGKLSRELCSAGYIMDSPCPASTFVNNFNGLAVLLW